MNHNRRIGLINGKTKVYPGGPVHALIRPSGNHRSWVDPQGQEDELPGQVYPGRILP